MEYLSVLHATLITRNIRYPGCPLPGTPVTRCVRYPDRLVPYMSAAPPREGLPWTSATRNANYPIHPCTTAKLRVHSVLLSVLYAVNSCSAVLVTCEYLRNMFSTLTSGFYFFKIIKYNSGQCCGAANFWVAPEVRCPAWSRRRRLWPSKGDSRRTAMAPDIKNMFIFKPEKVNCF